MFLRDLARLSASLLAGDPPMYGSKRFIPLLTGCTPLGRHQQASADGVIGAAVLWPDADRSGVCNVPFGVPQPRFSHEAKSLGGLSLDTPLGRQL